MVRKKAVTLRTSGQLRPYGGDERLDDSFWGPVNRARKLHDFLFLRSYLDVGTGVT